MKLDLGCGNHKQPGYTGMDPRPLEGVDIVADLNNRLPLPDDSVEGVMAVRSLPYAEDLFFTLSEVYRVCIHKAVVCILAPYAHHFQHIANPHLKHKFDEHTPRFWTDCFFQPPFGPVCPDVPHYAETPPPFDFRLVRMELFYGLPYHSPLYEEEDLELLHHLQANVVDEILYHFLVVKDPVSDEELDRLSRMPFAEPVEVDALRRKEEPALAGNNGEIPAVSAVANAIPLPQYDEIADFPANSSPNRSSRRTGTMHAVRSAQAIRAIRGKTINRKDKKKQRPLARKKRRPTAKKK